MEPSSKTSARSRRLGAERVGFKMADSVERFGWQTANQLGQRWLDPQRRAGAGQFEYVDLGTLKLVPAGDAISRSTSSCAGTQQSPMSRRSPRMTHLRSDRVTHDKRRAFIRNLQIGRVLSSPPKAGRWVGVREQTQVISYECQSADASVGLNLSVTPGWPCDESASGGLPLQYARRRGRTLPIVIGQLDAVTEHGHGSRMRFVARDRKERSA